MNLAGRWNLTLATPAGAQKMQLTLNPRDGSFTGRAEGAMGGYDISGSVDGNALQFVLAIKRPLPIKVTFHLTVEGDTISGHAKAGLLGKASVRGERAHDDAPQLESPEMISAESIDPQYREPYIERDEQRSDPVPHRYVHGGFKGTDAKFSFYFPPSARYGGRFFHNTYPLAMVSDVGPFPIAFDVATGDLAFTFDSGAYYVQTNLGGADRKPPADPAIAAYRVNAAAAKFSRQLARDIYGEHRCYGYLFGGSGGSYQVMGSAENTIGVWDGFVPFVVGTPNSIPSMFTVRMHALRVLRRRNKLAQIYDAISPGGSGDPYAGLNEEESAALRETSRLGLPLKGLWNHQELGSGYFEKIAGIVPRLDPSYLEDFWTKPGYLGAERDDSIHAERYTFETEVSHVVADGIATRIELRDIPERDIRDAHLVLLSGKAAGMSLPLVEIDGRTAGFSISADPEVVALVQPGDRGRIDNSWALALQTYQRHQVPDASLYGWNQYRTDTGEPLYPQREFLVGEVGAAATAGGLPEGRIHGKVLVLQCLLDIDAFPWQADWYRNAVRAALGERYSEQFALWFIEHGQHDNPASQVAHAHIINYTGVLQQALRDLAQWVETGMRPAETKYQVVDAQVALPASAEERGGIQPVVDLKVNGGARAEIAAGEELTFSATIEVPPGAGKIVAMDWDFEGVGDYPQPLEVAAPQAKLKLSATHRFSTPGTYFPVLRAVSQRLGAAHTPFGRIHNLGRVRVVVGAGGS